MERTGEVSVQKKRGTTLLKRTSLREGGVHEKGIRLCDLLSILHLASEKAG